MSKEYEISMKKARKKAYWLNFETKKKQQASTKMSEQKKVDRVKPKS